MQPEAPETLPTRDSIPRIVAAHRRCQLRVRA